MAYREIKCYEFLVKPFTQEQFTNAVSAALDLGKQMRKAVPVLRIEQKQFLFEYGLEQILYIESFGKKAVIHITREGIERSDFRLQSGAAAGNGRTWKPDSMP